MNRLLTMAAIGGACMLTACSSGNPVDEAEKAMVLRAADLVPFGYGLADTRQYESFDKTRYFDGSMDIVYEHETPDSEQDHPLYLNVTITFEKTGTDAIITSGAEKMAFMYALKSNGIVMREIPNFFPFGDSSEFHVLEKDGKPVGNHFTGRKGARVYTVAMTGMNFEDADEWKELIGDKLDKFLVYSRK